jgi:hydrophobic/amphiphilic exporter-1 (mainly G- bacteria), HAE1 family
MNMTRFALDRPVTVLMAFLAVALLGFISWQRLPLELLPSLNYPQITVLTTYENVAPPEIESLLSKSIEEAVGTVQGVRRVASISKEGVSLVTMDFEWGTDTNLSALDVREKIDVIRDALPRDVGNPIIIKFDPTSFPILTLGISGKGSREELTRIASDEIKQKLERIPGVALARISGAVEREILVSVDQGRLYAYGIPISAVVERLKEANFNFPGGSIEKGKSEIRIRTVGQFESLKDLEQVVITKGGGKVPVFLRDVATVTDTFKDRTSSFFVNGERSIGVSVFKQSDSNTVRVAEEALQTVKKLQKDLSSKVGIAIVHNQATFIEDAISDLESAGLLGGLLAFGVLLIFLGSFQSALIIAAAIPISVLGAFALMYMAGISLNIMSLGGLALGVGMLVDNGIVILENIDRHKRYSTSLYQAALEGAVEMKNPVLASTFAHIIVFLPILFVTGLAGKFFTQLALTISFSLLISIVVALALNPMLDARRLSSRRSATDPDSTKGGERDMLPVASAGGGMEKASGQLRRAMEKVMKATGGLYLKMLLLALSSKKKVLLLTLIILAASVALIPLIGKEFIPNVDQGSFVLQVTTPSGTTLETTEEVTGRIREVLSKEPEVKDVFVNIGYDRKEKTEKALGELEPNIAKMTVTLRGERLRTVGEVVNAVRPEITKIPEAEVEYILNQDVTQLLRQKQKAPEILEIRGSDLDTLRVLTGEVALKLRGVGCLGDVQSSLGKEDPEIKVFVDREKAARHRLTVKEIADTVKTAMEGDAASAYRDADQDVDIMVRLRDEDRKSIPNLENVLIHTPSGSEVPLKEVASINQGSRFGQIEHRDLNRVSVVSGNISGVAFSECLDSVKSALAGITPPAEHVITVSDQQEEMNRSFRSLAFALSLSILLVYMLLASLFESFLDPLMIMVAVPLAVVGVILILFLSGKTISLGVYIGGIMLGGIVVNNSIILVDYINTLRKRGIPRAEAVVEAGKARLRPILMTAMTTILGLLPLAVGVGRGSEIRSPLALTVIGGLSTSTFLTLLVIPVIYSLVDEFKTHVSKRRR